MKILVKLTATTGAPFVSDKNGNFPFIANRADNGAKIDGGLINGSVAKQLKLKDRGVYLMDITKTPSATINADTGKPYTNFRYTVDADLTEAVSTELAKSLASNLIAGLSSGSTYTAETQKELADANNPFDESFEEVDVPETPEPAKQPVAPQGQQRPAQPVKRT